MKRLFVLFLIAGCAPRPDAIQPIDMNGAFSSLGCEEARQLMTLEQSNLSALEKKQNGAATGDAIGVLLLGIPTSSLTGGDKSGEIAASKGKVLALEARLAGCRE